MDLSFFPLTLEAIDQAAAESLCLFISRDERPLTGLAGLADWRLSGRLSRLLRSGVLTGDAGEAVLTPPGSRLGFRKLFLFGLGSLEQDEETLVERVGVALGKLAQAGVQEAALQLPARLSADVGIRTLVDALQGPARAMVFGADPQRLVQALSHAASRGGAQHERRVVKVQAPAPPRPPPPGVKPPSPAVKPALPRASPLPFAPQADSLPAAQMTPPPPAALPRASPLPFAPPPPAVAPAVAEDVARKSEGQWAAPQAAAPTAASAAASAASALAPSATGPAASAPAGGASRAVVPTSAALAVPASGPASAAPAAPAVPAAAEGTAASAASGSPGSGAASTLAAGAAGAAAAASQGGLASGSSAASQPAPAQPASGPKSKPPKSRAPTSAPRDPEPPPPPELKPDASREALKPAPPPPQRYVPPPSKPHVFEKNKRRKKR